MRKLHYLFIALCVAGCQAASDITPEATPLLHTKSSSLEFSRTESLNLTDLDIIHPTKIIRADSLFVILTPKSPYRFAVYNTRSGKVDRFVPAGNGAGEGMYYLTLHRQGNTVSSLDFGTGRLVEIDLEQCSQPGYAPQFTDLTANGKIPLGAVRAGDRIISTGIYPEGRYCVSEPESGADQFSVPYPDCAAPNLSDSLKSIFYASNCLATNPAATRIACANMQYGCLDICDINGMQLKRVDEIHLTRPGISIQSRRQAGKGMWHPVAYTRNNLFGFCDLAVSEDCIFALYSGRTYREYRNDVDKGRVIFIFDWNGTHLRTLHIPNSCSSITYNEQGNAIHALSLEHGKAEIITLYL